MLRHLSFADVRAPSSRSQRFGAAVAVVAGLSLAWACGDSSSDAGHGGNANASGGKVANTGGGKGKGGSFGTGGASQGGDDSGSATPGDFDSVWKFDTANVQYLDAAAGNIPEPVDVKFPSTTLLPANPTEATSSDSASEREVELYRQFVDGNLVTYAYFTGETAYYRLVETALLADDAYLVTSGGSSHVFTLDAGRLMEASTTAAGTSLVYKTTHYKKLEGDFPPVGWPSEFVTYDATGESK